MITVAHEALIDLIVDPAGHVDPRLGGAGFNVTRAVARLGLPVAFLGRLSGDRFGQLLRADLERHGARIVVAAPSEAPTTLPRVTPAPAMTIEYADAQCLRPGVAPAKRGSNATSGARPNSPMQTTRV